MRAQWLFRVSRLAGKFSLAILFALLLWVSLSLCGCESLHPLEPAQSIRVLMMQPRREDHGRIRECLERALKAQKEGDKKGLVDEMATARAYAVRFLNPSSKHQLSPETIYQFLADRLRDQPPYPELQNAKELAALEARARAETESYQFASGRLSSDASVATIVKPETVRTTLESMLADWGEAAFVVDDVLVRHVSYFVKFFALCDRDETNRAIARSRSYLPHINQVFSRYALHEDIAFAVPFVESRFTTAACSTAGALGMFQFLASTARDYGLRVASDASGGNNAVDERLDWEKTAPAAARYLVRSRHVFASNVLALGAYHHGSMKVVEVLLAIAEKSKERSFRHIFDNDRLDAFSKEYIPQCLAAAYLFRWLKHAHLEVLPGAQATCVTIKEQPAIAKLPSKFGRVQDYNPDLAGADRLHYYASSSGYALVTKIDGQGATSITFPEPTSNESPRAHDAPSPGAPPQEESPSDSTSAGTFSNRVDTTSETHALTQPPPPGAQPYSLLYTFQQGNSLATLAATFGVELRTILSHPANRRHNQRYPLQPRPGDTIIIPGLPPTTTVISSQLTPLASEYRFYTSENQTPRQIAESVTEVLNSMTNDGTAADEGRVGITPELILYWNHDLLPQEIGIDDSLPPGIPLFLVTDLQKKNRPTSSNQ